MIFEDFIPLSPTHAVVTYGESLTKLEGAARVAWHTREGAVLVDMASRVDIVRGPDIRLGNVVGIELVYSILGSGIFATDMRNRVTRTVRESETYHQPFLEADGTLWVTDHAGHGIIRRDGRQFPFSAEGYEEYTNPWRIGAYVFFEARRDPAPHGWEVWRALVDGTQPVQMFAGANPVVMDGVFYHTDFSDYPASWCVRPTEYRL